MADLIDRQAAKNKKVYSEERHEYVVPVAEIDWLPSAEKTSSWEISEIKGFDGKPTNRFVASCRNCGFLTPDWRGRHHGLVGYYYCPQCGRRMEVKDDGND